MGGVSEAVEGGGVRQEKEQTTQGHGKDSHSERDGSHQRILSWAAAGSAAVWRTINRGKGGNTWEQEVQLGVSAESGVSVKVALAKGASVGSG